MVSARPERGTPCRRLIAAGAALALLLGVAGLLLDHLDRIGYFGGPLYTLLQAAGPPRGGLAVVLLSGDMGFNVGLSPRVGQRLAAAGYPVFAINSLTFAADGRSPAEVRALLIDAMRRALMLAGVRRLVLIGHSFGADLLHVGLVGLPARYRDKVALIILEVPTDTIYLSTGFREYFELGTPDLPLLASAGRLDWAPVTCIRGTAETTSLCPLLKGANIRTVTLPGGHALNHDAGALFAASADAIAHHRRPPPPSPAR